MSSPVDRDALSRGHEMPRLAYAEVAKHASPQREPSSGRGNQKAGPMVRIRFPPAESRRRTQHDWLIARSSAGLRLSGRELKEDGVRAPAIHSPRHPDVEA
jgi:hypothetical protein